jgi:hypothetical protein
MQTEFLRIVLIFTLPGLLLMLTEYYFRKRMRKQSGPNPEKSENHILLFYILGTAGLWVFTMSIAVIARELLSFNTDFFILIGFIIGVVSAKRSFMFWALTEDIFLKRHSTVESPGGLGLGCMGVAVFPLLGAIIGYIIHLIMK